MINSVHAAPQKYSAPQIDGYQDRSETTKKVELIVKIVFTLLAAAAIVAFTSLAVLSANPVFFVGTAIAASVIIGTWGVTAAAPRVGGYARRQRDPQVVIIPSVSSQMQYGAPAVRVERERFHNAPNSSVFSPARDYGAPARAQGIQILTREDGGGVHTPVGGRRR